ncbi:rhomboid family intramembrane serine protease [Cellulomonas sp. JZ18]|uniref:rhomboid family intramembrane serine protease n=1 Tax=Cellulomonas sp. JZ18 TaxID=2654191 RepID=UPI00351B4273
MAEAARSAPVARTALGAPLRQGRPVVTLTIIGLCVVSYVLQLVLPGWTRLWVFSPSNALDEPWRAVTSAFLHAQGLPLHLAFNMVALWMIGPYLESTLGRARFVTLYLLSAVGGAVATFVLAVPSYSPVPYPSAWWGGTVGASGAVFGLFGAVLLVLRRLGRDARGILGIIVLNGVLGFVLPGVSWQAHLGGLLVGLALGAAYAWAPVARRRLVAVVAPLAVVVLLVVATSGALLWLGSRSLLGGP